LQQASTAQQETLGELDAAVKSIQADLSRFADFADASKTELQSGLRAEAAPMAPVLKGQGVVSDAVSDDSADRDMPEELSGPETQSGALQPFTGLEKMLNDAHLTMERSQLSKAPDLQESAAALGSDEDLGQDVDDDTDALSLSTESELDIISQQLEQLSRETQVWDDQNSPAAAAKKGAKHFLFSVVLLVGAGSAYVMHTPTALSPTFSHNGFEVQLMHPAHRLMGPHEGLRSRQPKIGQQQEYVYRYEDTVLPLQWPIPDQLAGQNMTYGLANSALYIETALHSPVVSIAPGEVVFSGVNEGQAGRTVIVQHQDALISVYGHLGETFVGSGEHVDRGQVIARLGESQWLTPRLYFEIRYEGLSEDPYLYFAS
jgi:hypothetical protein